MTAGILLIAAAAAASGGYASPPVPQTGTPPPPPKVGFEPRAGARVPLNLPFRNESWKYVSLGECTAGKPTVLVLAYYRCPMLCTEVLNGLLHAVKGVPDDVGTTFNVVVVSFDPREKPPLAALKKAAYAEQYDRPGTEKGWHFLTGESLAIEALCKAVGFRYQYDPDSAQYAHGSGLVVLAPDGTIARYLLGIRFAPRDLRLALAEASEGKVSSPADQVMLLCFRYDPTTGKYTPAVLNIVRLASAVSIAFFAGLVGLLSWRGRRRTAGRMRGTSDSAFGGGGHDTTTPPGPPFARGGEHTAGTAGEEVGAC